MKNISIDKIPANHYDSEKFGTDNRKMTKDFRAIIIINIIISFCIGGRGAA